MADHDHTPTTSPTGTGRRALAGGAVLALLGATVATAAIPEANPDAELLRLCAEFDALERRVQAALNGAITIEEDEHAEKLAQAHGVEQKPLLNRMCALPCTTAAGAAALAASLLLWEGGEVQLEDDLHANTNERLLSALLRGVLGEA